MNPCNLQSGTITTLGQLRPGEARIVMEGEEDPKAELATLREHITRFFQRASCDGDIVIDWPNIGEWLDEYEHSASIWRDAEAEAISVGRKLAGRVAELELQVRTLREACEYVRVHECYGDRFACPKCYEAVKLALAATAPKEKP